MKALYIWFILTTMFFTNLVFGQKKQNDNNKKPDNEKITLQLKYLSTEAISKTYLDIDRTRHPVYNNREEAMIGFTKKVKESKNAISQDPGKPDFSKLPHTLYIWKTETQDQDEVKTEMVDYDLGKERAID